MNETVTEMSDYEFRILQTLDDLFVYAQTTQQLKYVISRNWVDRIQTVIRTWGAEKQFSDGGYNFYRILVPPCNSLEPLELERKLGIIDSVARRQGCLNGFRKTRGELGSRDNNQILASIFEIIILERLIEFHPEVQLFPKIRGTGQDVEAAFNLEGRKVYLEAKAIGYSSFDPKGPVGSQSIISMKRQVGEAIANKLQNKQQLAVIAHSNPTVLCLALGFHADDIAAEEEIETFLESYAKDVSAIVLFGSAFCNEIRIYSNLSSSCPLTERELNLLAHLGKIVAHQKSYRARSCFRTRFQYLRRIVLRSIDHFRDFVGRRPFRRAILYK